MGLLVVGARIRQLRQQVVLGLLSRLHAEVGRPQGGLGLRQPLFHLGQIRCVAFLQGPGLLFRGEALLVGLLVLGARIRQLRQQVVLGLGALQCVRIKAILHDGVFLLPGRTTLLLGM